MRTTDVNTAHNIPSFGNAVLVVKYLNPKLQPKTPIFVQTYWIWFRGLGCVYIFKSAVVNKSFLYMKLNNANEGIRLQCLYCKSEVEIKHIVTRYRWHESPNCDLYDKFRGFAIGVLRFIKDGGLGLAGVSKPSTHPTPPAVL